MTETTGNGALAALRFCPMLLALSSSLLLLSASRPASAEGRYEIRLLTISPGAELFTGFGHTAVWVIGPETGSDRVYDYGSYDSQDPRMAEKFLFGELEYWVSEMSIHTALAGFRTDFGGMLSQALGFTPEQAEAVAIKLAHDALPENKFYRYHHFRDNCATRIRDIFDEVLGGALRRSSAGMADGMTFRSLIESALYRAPHLRWPTYGLLNGLIDVPLERWERMFLPVYLMDELDRVRIEGADGQRHPLVTGKRQLFGTPPPLPMPTPSLVPWLLLVLGLALVLAGPAALPWPRFARAWTGAWLALLGLVGAAYGVLMIVMWRFAPYAETAANAHLLLLHPLHLALVPLGVLAAFGWRRSTRFLLRYLDAQIVVATLALLLRVLGLVVQHIEGFYLPVVVAAGGARAALWRHEPRA